jgi:hypothetical protein
MQRFYPSVSKRLEEEVQQVSRNDLKRWLGKCVERGYMEPTSDSDLVVKVLYESVQGMMLSDNFENEDMLKIISTISYSILIFIRGLCTVEGIKIIDSCFDKYFGNIPAPDAL